MHYKDWTEDPDCRDAWEEANSPIDNTSNSDEKRELEILMVIGAAEVLVTESQETGALVGLRFSPVGDEMHVHVTPDGLVQVSPVATWTWERRDLGYRGTYPYTAYVYLHGVRFHGLFTQENYRRLTNSRQRKNVTKVR